MSFTTHLTTMIDVILYGLSPLTVADLISGIVHWAGDSYITPSVLETAWYVPGPMKRFFQNLARKNIKHHDDPLYLLRLTYLQALGSTFPPFAAVMILSVAAGVRPWWWLVSAIALCGPLVHRWAHDKPARIPRVVRYLQHLRILQTAQNHRKHHVVESNNVSSKATKLVAGRSYCVITNAANYIPDETHAWRALEYIVYNVSGIQPIHVSG